MSLAVTDVLRSRLAEHIAPYGLTPEQIRDQVDDVFGEPRDRPRYDAAGRNQEFFDQRGDEILVFHNQHPDPLERRAHDAAPRRRGTRPQRSR